MKPHALILGDTLAGLVTAWQLCAADFTVTILKTNNHLHETPVSPTPPNETSDPLVLYGPHTHTDSLLRDLGISKQESNWKRISVECNTASSTLARFPTPPLPAPWHTLWGISTFSALPYRQRWRLLNYLEKVWEGATVLPSSLDLQSAESWLTSIGQTHPVQKMIWDPLCRFLIGTSLSHTRAGNFTTMLTRVFFQSRHHSPRITPLPQLSTLLVKSLITQLEQQGMTIHRIPAIELLQAGTEQITGVSASNGTLYTADSYIAAVHPTTLSSFLPERLLARYSSFHQIRQTTVTPRMTFNAISDHTINTPRLILHDGRFSWTLCRPTHTSKGRATLLSCVSTGDTDFLSETDERIKACAVETLQNVFPDQTFLNPELLHHYHIVRQPLGFVPDMPGTELSRPSNQTPIRNFLLAGSWTDTGASTEMESAIASGNMCAQTMINQLYKRH